MKVWNYEFGIKKLMLKLTEREFQILNLVAEGKTNSEIGDSLFISFHTVKVYLKKLYEKFGVNNRVQLVIKAIQLNIIDLS